MTAGKRLFACNFGNRGAGADVFHLIERKHKPIGAGPNRTALAGKLISIQSDQIRDHVAFFDHITQGHTIRNQPGFLHPNDIGGVEGEGGWRGGRRFHLIIDNPATHQKAIEVFRVLAVDGILNIRLTPIFQRCGKGKGWPSGIRIAARQFDP